MKSKDDWYIVSFTPHNVIGHIFLCVPVKNQSGNIKLSNVKKFPTYIPTC
jgi:hypothetical protein